jgi:hypothetical protein
LRCGVVMKRNSSLLVSSLLLLCLSGGLAAFFKIKMVVSAHPVAGQQTSAKPGPRGVPSLVYNEQLRRVILLDGYYPAIQPELSELWGWDGLRWERIPGVGPPARYVSSAAYDSRRKRIVSYGGRVGKKEEIKGDTWEWDGKGWQQMAGTGPGRRDHHALAYDAARGRTVLFGGGTFPRTSPWVTDTWEWDGVKWTQAATQGPVGRVAPLVYDSRRKQVVLFGGVGESPGAGQPQPHFNDTWVWDGKNWRKVSEAGPPARARHALAFDRRAGVVLLYGGSVDGSRILFDDMWQWEGKRWTEIRLTGPTPGKRAIHVMTYDAARGKTVLYGGTGQKVLDDTWEWDGKQWAQIKY